MKTLENEEREGSSTDRESDWMSHPSVQEWLDILRKNIQKKVQRKTTERVHSLFIQQDNPMEYIIQKKGRPQSVPFYTAYSVYEEEIKTFCRTCKYSTKKTGSNKQQESLQEPIGLSYLLYDPRYSDKVRIALSLIIEYLTGKQKILSIQDQASLCRLQGALHTVEYDSKGDKHKNYRHHMAHNIQDAPILVAQPFFHLSHDAYRRNHYSYHAAFQQHYELDEGKDSFAFISYTPLHPEGVKNFSPPFPAQKQGKEEEKDTFRCILKMEDAFSILEPTLSTGRLQHTLHLERALFGACAYPLYDYIGNIRHYGWQSPLLLKNKNNRLSTTIQYSREDHLFSYEVMRSLLPSSLYKSRLLNPFIVYAKVQDVYCYILPTADSKLSEYLRYKRDLIHYNLLSRKLGYSNPFMLHGIYVYLNHRKRKLYKSLPRHNMLSIRPVYVYELKNIYPIYFAYPTIYFRYRELYAYHLYKLLQTKDRELIRQTIQLLPSLFKSQVNFYQYTRNRAYDNKMQHRFVALLNFLYNKTLELFPNEDIHKQIERTWGLLTESLPFQT